MKVLELEPTHPEALRELGLNWHRGQLLSKAQIADQIERAKQAEIATRQWKPRLAQWKRDIEHGKPAERDAALAQLRAVRDPAAIAALESALKTSRKLGLELIAALHAMTEQEATEALLRQAVLSQFKEVRQAAADELKQRPLHNYVPILLSGLTAPLQSNFDVVTDKAGNIGFRQTLSREQENQTVAQTAETQVVFGNLKPGQRYSLGGIDSLFQSAMQSADTVDRAAEKANKRVAQLNERIFDVLRRTSGQDIKSEPRLWWDWWHDYNDIYTTSERPYLESYYVQRYYVPRYDAPASTASAAPRATGAAFTPATYGVFAPPHSCFARGTQIWTLTGLAPIEEVKIGDRVLAQNPESGELAYKPVLKTTLRPERPMVKISLGGDSITSTEGHLFWVSGRGWQMAKELQQGSLLHGVSGAVPVESVQPAAPAAAYNLIVADFNSYFVGASRVLVQDNTPRKPTDAIVPGLAMKLDRP
jgi:hypothetical protein